MERERSGYARAIDGVEAASSALSNVESEIESHAEGSVLALAGSLMVELRVDGEEEGVMRLYRLSLAAIRPQLVGVIAEDADRMLAMGDVEGGAV